MKHAALLILLMLATSSEIARADEPLSQVLNESVIKLPVTVKTIFLIR